MKEKMNLSNNALRKIVCEHCRSKVSCEKKGDAAIMSCPIIGNYKQTGAVSFPMDDWY